MKLLFVLCLYFILSKSAKLPPNFKKCNRKQPDLDKCVFEAAQHGITQLNRRYRNLNIPNCDPLKISEISAHVKTSLINMNERLTNCVFYGLLNVKLESFEFDLDRKIINATAIFPDVKTHCHYKINGEILFNRISSEGPSALNFKNFNVCLFVTYNEVRRNDKTYADIANVTVDGRPEEIHFKIDNIISGDKEQSDFMNRLINDNWKELFDDIKDEYFHIADQLLFQLLRGLFSKLSLEEAFD